MIYVGFFIGFFSGIGVLLIGCASVDGFNTWVSKKIENGIKEGCKSGRRN